MKNGENREVSRAGDAGNDTQESSNGIKPNCESREPPSMIHAHPVNKKAEPHNLEASIPDYIASMLQTPDGLTAALVSIFCIIGLFVPEVIFFVFSPFNVHNNSSTVPATILLVPPMQLIGYIWLNGFAKNTIYGKLTNSILLLLLAYLFINPLVK